MNKYILSTLITGLSLCCGYGLSMAADPVGSIPVSERSFEGFEPMGLKLGRFMAYPSLEKEVGYTSNIFQTSDNEQSDRIYTLRPEVKADASFGKHELSMNLKADHVRYDEFDAQNYTDYSATIQNSFNFSEGFQFDIGGILSRNHARRLDSIGDEVTAAEPIQSDVKSVFAKMILKPARFQWELGLNYADTSYKDVSQLSSNTVLVQRDRNRSSIAADVSVTYDSGTRFKPFMGLTYTRTNYDHLNYIAGSGFTGANQDRDRIDTMVGINFAPTGKLRGTAKIGYGYEMTDDASLDNQGDSLVDIDLTYLYTPLTNFNFGFERFFSDDTSAVQGVVETRLSASIIHELTRQWILSAGTQFSRREFQNDDKDETLTATVGADYKLNRHFTLGGEIQHIDRESNRVNGDFEETRGFIRLKSAF